MGPVLRALASPFLCAVPGPVGFRARRHFAFARAGQLWMNDIMHGPVVSTEGRTRRKTFHIAFLDGTIRRAGGRS